MAETTKLPLAYGGLDRDANTRMDASALDAAWSAEGTVLLRVQPGSRLPITAHANQKSLDLVPVHGARQPDHFYLGRANGTPVFAAVATEVDGYPEPAGGWRHPFAVGAELAPLDLEIMTVAFALVGWNSSMQFSATDGSRTVVAQGGWARVDEHGGEHFPRTDPAVIMLVEHEGRLLLGSNVLWETGRFSLLAGFVEAGESAEQAVVREVFEESGMPVENVQYVASQPWPFPRSLMLGFRATLAAGADPEALDRDVSEISELRWFSRDELRNPSPDLLLPRGISIAGWLMNLWIAEGDSAR